MIFIDISGMWLPVRVILVSFICLLHVGTYFIYYSSVSVYSIDLYTHKLS